MEAGLVPTLFDLKEYLTGVFTARQQEITFNDTPYIAEKRNAAFKVFSKAGFPHSALENWCGTDLSRSLNHEYLTMPEPPSAELDIDKIFKCDVPHFETLLISQLNGWYADRKNLLQIYANGIIIGSLSAAFHKYPDLINAHYGHYANDNVDSLTALNTAMSQDGIFIYVPDNVTVEQNVQMVNITDFRQNLFLNTRNLIILGTMRRFHQS